MKSPILALILMFPGVVHCQTIGQRRAISATMEEPKQVSIQIAGGRVGTISPQNLDLRTLGQNPMTNPLKKKPSVEGHRVLKSGGVDAGGANSVAGPKRKRQLLDLAEKDELEYFIPNTAYGSNSDASRGMATLLTHSTTTECSDLHNEVEGFADTRFIKIFATAYGLERLKKNKVSIKWCSSNVLAQFDYNKGRWDKEIQKDITEGRLPIIKPLRWAFVEHPLETIEDSGLIRVENPSTKIQVAIQKDSFVVINKIEFNKMDSESQNALFIHEAALYAVKLLNPELIKSEGTAPVRTYVRNLVRYFDNWALDRNGKAIFPPEPVREAFAALNVSK